MRIAMFVGAFPVISEAFILRQITGLKELGHEVDIFAEVRPAESTPIHTEVKDHDLLTRTTYMDLNLDISYWEQSAWPIRGRTWLPDSDASIPNVKRILSAMPKLMRCLIASPLLTLKVLDTSQYGYQACSLSALHRLSALSSQPSIYDVIHAHFGPIGNNFRFVKELWNVPYVVSFHGYDFSMWPRWLGQDIYHKLFDCANAVTINSQYTRRRLEELGCPTHKLYKIPMGIDPREFPFAEGSHKKGEKIRILTVGRLVEKKGLEYSIRAVAKVLEKHPELCYDIIGEGPLKTQLKRLIHELGVEKSVKLHGAQNNHFVRKMMAEAHIFMLTSITSENGDQEGQGLVLQEAQASGLPLIVTDHNGFSESMVPGQSGFLVPERDIENLSVQLTYLVEHSETWPDMGRKGRKHVEEHYNIGNLNRQLVDLYHKVILEHGRKARTRRKWKPRATW